jgi:hypothetical protein
MLKYFGFNKKNRSHWGIMTRNTGYYINGNNWYNEKYILPALRFFKSADDDAITTLSTETGIEIVWWTYIFQIVYFKDAEIGG